jgi:zinc transporter ZupT
MHWFEYLLLFAIIFLSGWSFLWLGSNNEMLLKLSLAFSGAFLFTISIIHLIPALYEQGGSKAGYFILAGFFLQIVIEFFSEGIEHGHTHSHSSGEITFPVTMMAGLCLHSFLEGMPLEGDFNHGRDHHHSHVLLTGIILHHIPVALALMSMLYASGLGRFKSLLWLSVFALMAPLGALTSRMLKHAGMEITPHFFDYTMAVVVGIFLHISTTILFESNKNHRFNLFKLLTVLAGGALAILLF